MYRVGGRALVNGKAAIWRQMIPILPWAVWLTAPLVEGLLGLRRLLVEGLLGLDVACKREQQKADGSTTNTHTHNI